MFRTSAPFVQGIQPQNRGFGRSSGPPPGGFSLIANTAIGSSTGGTTTPIDTTGADLIAIALSYYAGGGPPPPISDSYGNTWTALTPYGSFGGMQIVYADNPIVGPGHTFTESGFFGAHCVAAFSGANSSPFDTGIGTSTSGFTAQPGSITPAVSGELFVTGINFDINTASVSIDSGFSITDQIFSGSVFFNVALAYKASSGSSPENPTWTTNISSSLVPAMASFKPA